MLQYVPNNDYQYGNARIEAFMTYLKDITNRSNSEILCVTDGIVTPEMMEKLSERVLAECDTENGNEWYRDGKQVMITSTNDIKDKFNMKQLNQLHGDIIELPAKDIPSKGLANCRILPM